MNYTVIACETLRDELTLASNKTGCQHTVIWVESDYHIDPDKLRSKLQEEIDALENVDGILFAYGCCGNGLVGLRASSADLIIPKTDDCISMVLSQPGKKYQRHKQTYFLTKGWMESSKSIVNEYWHAMERYGEKRAKRLFELMLKHYNYLMLIDTGAYNLNECLSKAQELAGNTNLELKVEKGSTWFMEKLLTGPHDEDFCIIPKGGVVNISHFGYDYKDSTRQALL